MKAYIAKSVEDEYVLIIRTQDQSIMLSLLRKLQKLRYREAKQIFWALEEELYD